MTSAAILIFASLLALALYIRLAPDDPARWHIPIAHDTPANAGPCADQVQTVPKGASATCLLPEAPAELLARLDAIALASPRTTRLAGTPETGRITWVARSRLMHFPDYITAEARQTPQGTRLDVLSRQRYGSGDHGVNAARLQAWLASL